MYIILILIRDISEYYRARWSRKTTMGRRRRSGKKDPMSPSFESGQSGRVGSGQVRDNNLIIILSYYYYSHHRNEIERETGLRRRRVLYTLRARIFYAIYYIIIILSRCQTHATQLRTRDG